MNKVLLEGLQPKEEGLQLSWFNFKKGKVVQPSLLEKLFKVTIPLTDIITNFYSVAKGIDPNSQVNIIKQKGFLEPDFKLKIKGKDFEIEINKYFAGGSDRSNCFNYKIDVLLFSPMREKINQIISSYKIFGPIPLYYYSS